MWNGEILRGLSTVEAPSLRIQYSLRAYKAGLIREKEKNSSPSSQERVAQLLEWSIIRELSRLTTTGPPSSFSVAGSSEETSSPIEYGEEDPLIQIREFFLWWAKREERRESDIPVGVYQDKLVIDKWRINDLYDSKDGLTWILWKESCLFLMGHYANMCRAISEWKIIYKNGRLSELSDGLNLSHHNS